MDSCSRLEGCVPTYDDLSKSYKKSEMKIKDLRRQLQESRQKVEEIYKQKRITKKKDDDLQKKLARAQEIAAENEKQISHWQESNHALDKKHDASLKEIAEYEMQLEVYDDMHLISMEDKKSFSEELKEMEEAKGKVEKYNLDLERREEVALKEVVEYKTRNEENHNAFVKSEEERKSYSNRLTETEESKARILKLREETERLKNQELEESRKAIQKLKLEMDSVKKQLADTREDNEKLQRTSIELSRAIKITRLEGKMDISDKENMISDLMEQIQTLNTENDLLKKKKKNNKCFLSRIFCCCFRLRRARR